MDVQQHGSPFGSSPAGLVLAQILANEPKLRRKLTTLVSEYHQGLRVLAHIEPAYLRRRMWRLWYEEHDAKVRTLAGDIGTFTRNILRGAYREALHEEKAA